MHILFNGLTRGKFVVLNFIESLTGPATSKCHKVIIIHGVH